MPNNWDLDKKLDVGKKYNKYLKVKQKAGQKFQPSVKVQLILHFEVIFYL